jgi:hypothetical protein
MDELKKHLESDMSDEEKKKLKEELEAPINRDSDNQSTKWNNINDSIHSVMASFEVECEKRMEQLNLKASRQFTNPNLQQYTSGLADGIHEALQTLKKYLP